MHLAIHIGAHYTDEDQMVRCLLADASELLNLGIAVPSPARYRQQLRSLAQELAHKDITKDVESGILEAIFGNV